VRDGEAATTGVAAAATPAVAVTRKERRDVIME
jgi:hypothetical protein